MSGVAPPLARIAPDTRRSPARFLPLLALALVAGLLLRSWQARGPRITLRASAGHGLAAGDELRYRGIAVGAVESVELAPGLDQVVLALRLQRSAAPLARSGSRFWIVRPVLGVEGARGLETLLGSRYLAVQPGPEGAPAQGEFVALEEPPLPELEEPGGLEILLEAPERSGLARGAPLAYRGVRVGTVVSVELASDATGVELRARIREGFGELVREDTRFWKQGGAQLSLGLAGLELEVGSLQSLWMGGIALATPTHPGERARMGQRFLLADAPEEEWLAWRPALALGGEPLAGAAPELVRCRLAFEGSGWFGRGEARSGWLLGLDGGLVGPADLLVAPRNARPGSAVLELLGERVLLDVAPSWSSDGLALRAIDSPGVPVWPAGRVRPLEAAEDCLVLGEPALAPIAVAAAHLERDGTSWRVGPDLSFDERWHGAAVLARGDGALVGILLIDEGRGTVAPIRAP